MKKAFTLIELLIVIAIIAILAAILFVSIGQQPLLRSRDAQRVSTVQNLRTSLAIYYTNNDAYPANLAALQTANLIPEVPVDPRDNDAGCGLATFDPDGGAAAYAAGDYGYFYSQGTTDQSYVLSVCLEDTTSSALESDCDTGTLDPACQADPVYDIHS